MYENGNVECTEIVTTCWATADVIKEAARLNANLIIAYEVLFWNREIIEIGYLDEYIRDASMLNQNNAIIGMKHLNLGEPRMEYMIQYLCKKLIIIYNAILKSS